jgi:serine/threonine-protein kinase
MSTDPRVSELLLRWEELCEEGCPVSLEALCRDSPHLLEEVRRGARKLQAINPLLQIVSDQTIQDGPATFAPSDRTQTPAVSELREPSQEPLSLPAVAGYEVLGELGRGGMGIVYLARQPGLGRLVALKMLLSGAYTTEAQRRRFRAEAEAAARLQHPNVVQVFEVGEHDGHPFFALEYVQGCNLAEALAGAPAPPRAAAELLAAVADAVHAAHERGIIHRDLKPNNILLAHPGPPAGDGKAGPSWLTASGGGLQAVPKVTDFGLAKDLEEARGLTETGAVLGTPTYMAPEQAEGRNREVGPPADIYALGAALYETLTGRPPLLGATALETLQRVLTEEPLPPRRLNPAVPRDLETICLKCLAKEPHKRYASAGELAADLRRFLAGEPIRARRTRPWERALKWARRRPAAAVLLVLGVLAAVGLPAAGVAYSAHLRHRQEEADREARHTEQEVRAAMHQVALLREQARTAEAPVASELLARARAQAQRARLLSEKGLADAELAGRVRGLLAELEADDKDRLLVADLDAALLAQAEHGPKGFAWERALPKFREAFARYGLPVGQGSPEVVAARLEQRPQHLQLAAVSTLQRWIHLAEMPELTLREPHLGWLRAALAGVEARPWGKEMFVASARLDPVTGRAALEKLADSIDFKRSRGRGVLDLMNRLLVAGARDKALALVRRALLHHPDDFWLNHTLAMELAEEDPVEAVRLLAAATALRPLSAPTRANLAGALNRLKKWDEAIAQCRKAIELEPRLAIAHNNLGKALRDQGKPKEALKAFRAALEIDPTSARSQSNYALALQDLHRLDEAIAEHYKAVKLEPEFGQLHNNLGVALYNANRFEDAAAAYQQAIQLESKHAPAHSNLGFALVKLGKLPEAMPAFQKAVELDPNLALPHSGIGILLFIQEQLKEAETEFRRALALDPHNQLAHIGLGDLLPRLGRYDEAALHVRAILKTLSKNSVLRPKLEKNLQIHERMIERERKLSQVLAREIQPDTPADYLGYIKLCRQRKLNAAAASLYADALATKPALKKMALVKDHRLAGARLAALAGSGQGEDAQYFDQRERARWRKQALDWLLADLNITRGILQHKVPQVRLRGQKRLHGWQNEKDLAGIRDQPALDRLPVEEQWTYREFWAEVAELLARSEAIKK